MIRLVFWSFLLALFPLALGLGWRLMSILGNLIEDRLRRSKSRGSAMTSAPVPGSILQHRSRISAPTLVHLCHPLQWARGLHAERPSRIL